MALSIKSDEAGMEERLHRLRRDVALLPVHDPRSADEILGYDENGLPT